MKLSLSFGAIVPSIYEQLIAAGFKVTRSQIDPFQHDAEALSRLTVRGIMTQKESDKSYERLIKSIAKYLQAK
jgi:hypothetical protein